LKSYAYFAYIVMPLNGTINTNIPTDNIVIPIAILLLLLLVSISCY